MRETLHTARGEYRQEIDGLRAFAVVAVIINHFNKDILPGGYLGVDIFFVISGYVITLSLSRKKIQKARDFFVSFYISRLKRILPALLTCIAISSALISIVSPVPGESLWGGIWAAIGGANIYFYLNATNYFSDGVPNLFLQTWSLGIEEQFYLIFPFIFWFFRVKGKKARTINPISICIFSLSLISIGSFIYFDLVGNAAAAYFLPTSRFWELGAGCLCFTLFSKGITSKKSLRELSSFISLLIMLFLFFLGTNDYYAPWSNIAAVMTTCLFVTSCDRQTKTFRLMSHRLLTLIGRASFSLYLYHWTILVLFRWTLGVETNTIFPIILCIIFTSFISYKYLEIPFYRRDIPPAKVLRSAFALVVSTIILLLFLGISLRHSLKEIGQFFFPWRYEYNRVALLSSKYNEMLADGTSADTEHAFFRILLVGDSHVRDHGDAIVNSLKAILPQNKDIKFYLFNPPFDNKARQKLLINQLFLRNKFDLVVIANETRDIRKRKNKRTQSNSAILDIDEQRVSQYKSQIQLIAKHSGETDTTLYMVEDLPIPCANKILKNPEYNTYDYISDVFLKGDHMKCSYHLSLTKKINFNMNSIYKEIEREYTNAKFIEVAPYFCPNRTCTPIIQDVGIYSDLSPHFSSHPYSRKLINQFWRNEFMPQVEAFKKK